MIFILLIVDVLCFCYHLKNEENVGSYIKGLTEKFGKDAGDTVFFGIIEPPVLTARRRQAFLFPKIFLWSPQEQHSAVCMLKCPTHKETALKPWKWTNCLGESNSSRPRLVNYLLGNVLLVQRIYLCSQTEKLTRYMVPLQISSTCYSRVLKKYNNCFNEVDALKGCCYIKKSNYSGCEFPKNQRRNCSLKSRRVYATW